MTQDLQSFNFGLLGVRVLRENDKIYFVGIDVARALGYKDPKKAIIQHCRDGGVKHPLIDSMGRSQEAVVITEGDVYRLVMRSKLPSAEKFERWVVDDVLPTIRKHGVYATPQTIETMISDPETTIKILEALKGEQEKRKQLEIKVEADAPKVLFANSVETSKTSILIGDMAKILKQNGFDIGQNRLFEWLRARGYLMGYGESRNMPTQYSMDLGLMEVQEGTVSQANGNIRLIKTTKITGKGQVYFIKKFREFN